MEGSAAMAKGSCLCGNIKYSVDVEPNTASTTTNVCHCRPCRKITGASSSLNLTVPRSVFYLNSGTLRTIKTTHVDEGFDFSLSFCPECGSPIYAVPHWAAGPDIVVIQAGTLDEPDTLMEKVPVAELYVKHRLGWMEEVTGAEQRQRYMKDDFLPST